MRAYVVNIIPTRDENIFDFSVLRHGEEIFNIKACAVPGLDAVREAIAKDWAEDPL